MAGFLCFIVLRDISFYSDESIMSGYLASVSDLSVSSLSSSSRGLDYSNFRNGVNLNSTINSDPSIIDARSEDRRVFVPSSIFSNTYFHTPSSESMLISREEDSIRLPFVEQDQGYVSLSQTP